MKFYICCTIFEFFDTFGCLIGIKLYLGCKSGFLEIFVEDSFGIYGFLELIIKFVPVLKGFNFVDKINLFTCIPWKLPIEDLFSLWRDLEGDSKIEATRSG
jgi:hypothetical protein